MQLLGMIISTLLFLNPLVSNDTYEFKKPFTDYLQECPWIGLIADQISFGPITVSNVNIQDGDKFTCVAPGEILHGSLKYKVDSKNLHLLHLYHLVIGIKDEGAQDCITHNLGLWNSKGIGHFTLQAPSKPGVYEVRFLFTEAMSCACARVAWDNCCKKPSAAATIGIIIVE